MGPSTALLQCWSVSMDVVGAALITAVCAVVAAGQGSSRSLSREHVLGGGVKPCAGITEH